MSDLTANFALYDSEILKMEQVIEVLNRKQGTATNLEGFRQEIIDRFAKIGLKVDVKVYSTNLDGTYAFDIDIQDRLDKNFKWDPNQMVHEVTNDLLELGEGGIIKTKKEDFENGHGH